MSHSRNGNGNPRQRQPYGPHFINRAAWNAYGGAQAYLTGWWTLKEAADKALSCVPYVAAMASIIQSEDEKLLEDVLRGRKSVLEAAKQVKARAKAIASIRRLTAADKGAVGRAIGVGEIWDGMIVPSL
jgi:hypothetical protein